jgi:hypothetical protein
MKTLRATILVLGLAGWAGIARADLESDKRETIKQVRELSMRYSQHVKGNRPLPATFAEFLGEDDASKRLLVSPLAKDPTKPSYQLFTPAAKLANVVDPTRTRLMQSTFRLPDGKRIVAFVDGLVALLDD